MLVCICKGITDRRLQEEIRRGNSTLGALQQCCRAGTDCGACVTTIRRLLASAGAPAREQSAR